MTLFGLGQAHSKYGVTHIASSVVITTLFIYLQIVTQYNISFEPINVPFLFPSQMTFDDLNSYTLISLLLISKPKSWLSINIVH